MKDQASAIRMSLQKSLLLERAEDVPYYRIRTPLQRATQLLKRHRDMMFNDLKTARDKPASIIITTLAARSYDQMIKDNALPTDFIDLLMEMLHQMPSFIVNPNGEPRIDNPVDPSENFGDRWKRKPIRKKHFFDWIEKAKSDFTQALRKNDIQTGLDTTKYPDKMTQILRMQKE